ncbi:MAG: hypothetical protein OXE42_04250 [Gammaproteobacteria bacterium]|nr:hypothetical protein [Gammaproteobacteria bacterium]
MSVYTPICDYLSGLKQDSVMLSFTEVEDITGRTLPDSALKYRLWWENDETHTQAVNGWMAAGWQTTDVDLHAMTVRFSRTRTAKNDHAPAKTIPMTQPGQGVPANRRDLRDLERGILGPLRALPEVVDKRTNDRLTVLEGNLNKRLDVVDRRLNGLDKRLEAIDTRIGLLETNLKTQIHKLELQLGNLDQTAARLERIINGMDQKLDVALKK